MNKIHKCKKGFSFTEVILAVLIIGVLSAIATPTILTWIPSSRLQSASRDLYADMQQAKITAIKENLPATLTFVTVGAAGDGTCAGGSYTFTVGGVNVANRTMVNGLCIASARDPNIAELVAGLAPAPADPQQFAAGDGFTNRGLAIGAPNSQAIAVTDNSLRSPAVFLITQTAAGGVRLSKF